ncbi:phage terminase small subunit [Streptomyces lydicus]
MTIWRPQPSPQQWQRPRSRRLSDPPVLDPPCLLCEPARQPYEEAGPCRGPVPKRSDQRRRHNEPAGPALVKTEAGKAPTIPRASGGWHPIAKRWFQSLKGQWPGPPS